MSDFLRLLPSGMATASANDTFLTQLMNDNMRRAENQLPCAVRILCSGVCRVGFPVRLSAVNPPTAGQSGPFLGIVVVPPQRNNEIVVQLVGLALVMVTGDVAADAFIGVDSSGNAAPLDMATLGTDNYIGNVVSVVKKNKTHTLAYVLLRSWCGKVGRSCQDGLVPSGALGADPRPVGAYKFTGGKVSVAKVKVYDSALKVYADKLMPTGFALAVTAGTEHSDNSATFSFTKPVHNALVRFQDAAYRAIVATDGSSVTIQRYDGTPLDKFDFNILGSVEG